MLLRSIRKHTLLQYLVDIIRVIEKPLTTTKIGRLYTVSDDVLKLIHSAKLTNKL